MAFVSSVGKIHMPTTSSGSKPDEDNDDEAEDPNSEEFRKLLSTITREEVDKHLTKCPHPDTAEKMTKVCPSSSRPFNLIRP